MEKCFNGISTHPANKPRGENKILKSSWATSWVYQCLCHALLSTGLSRKQLCWWCPALCPPPALWTRNHSCTRSSQEHRDNHIQLTSWSSNHNLTVTDSITYHLQNVLCTWCPEDLRVQTHETDKQGDKWLEFWAVNWHGGEQHCLSERNCIETFLITWGRKGLPAFSS